jgi:hypothetical protein
VVEDLLAHVLNNLTKGMETVDKCEGWWSIARSEAPIFDCPRIFKDVQLKSELQKSMIYQMLMISQIGYLDCQEALPQFSDVLK